MVVNPILVFESELTGCDEHMPCLLRPSKVAKLTVSQGRRGPCGMIEDGTTNDQKNNDNPRC